MNQFDLPNVRPESGPQIEFTTLSNSDEHTFRFEISVEASDKLKNSIPEIAIFGVK